MEKFIADDRIHEGHRKRMRSKVLAHGKRIFDTYELLEMLLYHTNMTKDTNPTAKRLLSAFGGLDGIFKAKTEELTNVSGVGLRTAELLHKVGKLSDILGAEIVPECSVDFSKYDSVGEFLVDYFYEEKESCVVALYFDSSMRLIEMKRVYDIEFDSGGVKAKPFIDSAVACRAAVIITAHNHPHGPFFPTPGDRETDKMLSNAIKMLGFVHAEHYIVSGEYYAGIDCTKSFLDQIRQMPAVGQFMESRGNVGDEMPRASTCIGTHDLEMFDKNYNTKDLPYFADLLRFAIGKKADETALLLLRKYQTIENVFTASSEEISMFAGENVAFFVKILAYVTSRRVTDSFSFGSYHSSAEIADYFKAIFIGESVEKIYLMSFNKKGAPIRCDLLGEGTVTSTEIIPRRAAEIAVSCSASSVSMAHNHPFGRARASQDDENFTRALKTLFNSCEIGFDYHYIVAGQLCEVLNFEN